MVLDDRIGRVRKMILLRGILAPMLTMLTVCAVLVILFAADSRKRVRTDLDRIASGHIRLVDQFFAERIADLQTAAASIGLSEARDSEALSAMFHRLQAGSEAFFDLGIFNDEGTHLAYVGPFDLAGRNYADADWFVAVRERGIYISDVFLGVRRVPHFVIAVRRIEEGKAWYLRATIDTLYFTDLVESIRVGRTGEAYLLNREGIFQTRRRSGGDLMDKDGDLEKYPAFETGVLPFSIASNGRKYVCAAGPLQSVAWTLVVRQDQADAFAPLRKAVAISGGLIAGGGSVVAVLAFLLSSGLATRLTLAQMEKQQLRTQLILAGRLAEIGEMSTGLAHEINNPLQVIQSEKALLEDVVAEIEGTSGPCKPDAVGAIRDSLREIGVQVDRCARITQGLLDFARKGDQKKEEVLLQEFLPQIARMVRQRAVLQNINLVVEYDEDLPPFLGDPNQMQQVFLNLLNNAIHSLRGRKNGEVRVVASLVGSEIVVSVADNGCGITPENMERIFLPFFTTKPPGEGTGLGLSTAYGILQGCGGEITVASEFGAGTVFTVRLPLAGGRSGITEEV